MNSNAIAKRQRVSEAPRSLTIVDPAQVFNQIADVSAERAMIGAILLSPASYDDVAEMVQPADFALLMNGYIWWAFEQLKQSGDAIDLNSVIQLLNTREAGMGDRTQDTLAQCMAEGTPAAALTYARRIRRAAMKMRILRCADDMKTLVMGDAGTSSEMLVDQINEMVFSATDQISERATSISQAVDRVYQKIENVQAGELPPVTRTGFDNIDKSPIGGLAKGELTVLAGNEGMGKTTWALTLLRNLMLSNRRAAIFSLEMTQDEIVRAFLSMTAGVPRAVLRAGRLTEDQWDVVAAATGPIKKYPLDIIDKREYPTLTPLQLRRRLRKLWAKAPLELVVIDGLWLMEYQAATEAIGRKAGALPRTQEVHYITRELCDIATEFDVPILLMHQYSAEMRLRKDKRPTIYDLAESASVRRNAQMIWALYRASYHDKARATSFTQLFCLKDRNGGSSGETFDFVWEAGYDRYKAV